MEEDFRIQSSVLADLGPLPEVVESNSDTVWQTFLQLEAQSATTSLMDVHALFEALPEQRWTHMGR